MDDMTLRELRGKGQSRKYQQEMRRRWGEAGLCTACGKSPAVHGFKICAGCLAARREQAAKRKPKPPQDTEDKWLVSAATCKGCKWYGYLYSSSKNARMCNYTLYMRKIRHNPPSRCEVKELGRLMKEPPVRPLPRVKP